MSIEVIETHTILPDIVSPGSIVVDCGANVGRFSLEMIRTVWLCMLRDRSCAGDVQQNSSNGKLASLQFRAVRNQ